MADGLSLAASAAGIVSLGIQVTQSLVNFYSAYKNQKSDVTQTTKRLEYLLGVLEILYNQSSNRTFLAHEQQLFETIKGSIQNCKEYIDELQNECNKVKEDPAGGIRATARTATYRVAYPFRQSTLQRLDENIDEIISHISLTLQVLEQKDVHKVQNDIEDTKELLNLVRASQISSDIRDWLRAPDTSVNYNEACKKSYGSTGLWLVKGASFSSWLAKPNSFLWLNGFAGCGKSVLCSTAIQHAFRHRRSNPRIGIAFFFFTFSDNSKQSASAMLRVLVLQLSGQLNDNQRLLSQLHNSYPNAMPSSKHFLTWTMASPLVDAVRDASAQSRAGC
ncbi:hypothetical protein BJ170DRAFT_607348 [Xylariales sp. AK1849]|nr:hypothetical protein BJ170DRAFT_607348 [Xylariales sp. AK1849]